MESELRRRILIDSMAADLTDGCPTRSTPTWQTRLLSQVTLDAAPDWSCRRPISPEAFQQQSPTRVLDQNIAAENHDVNETPNDLTSGHESTRRVPAHLRCSVRQRRAGCSRQASGGSTGRHLHVRWRTPAGRGCARSRKDGSVEIPRPFDRRSLRPNPVHSGPPPVGCHRHIGVESGFGRVHIPPRSCVLQRGARR